MSRPMLARKDTRADEDRQRRAVRARDGNVCRFEVWTAGNGWLPCGKKSASDTCHVYPRRECGKAVFHDDVALLGCRDCHDAYDGRTFELQVRVPPAREEAAWAVIAASSRPRRVVASTSRGPALPNSAPIRTFSNTVRSS